MKKRLIVITLALILILLAACGGQEETPPEPVALEPAPELVPTVEAEVAPTEPAPTVEVPEAASPLDTMDHVPDSQLVDIVWQWQERTSNMGEETLITVPDPEAYTLTFNPDGSFIAKVDCNNVQGLYATDMPGNIYMETGPSTMVFCGDDSVDQDMLQLFGPAQSYVFEEDGQVLVLKWVAGGPYDYFRNAEAAAESEEEEAEGISEDAIQMDLQGLAETFDWEVQPASPIPTEPEEGNGFPPHVLITFDGESVEDVLANNGRRMYIFPSQPYIDLYNAADDSIVADQFERLLQILKEAGSRQGLPESPMPVLPPPDSYMNRWAQYRELSFEEGSGVGYVSDSPYRKDIGPWTNETTGYYYQGISEDGLFYVSLFWPVSTAGLPDTAADVAPDVAEQATNPDTYEAYLQDTQAMLNATSDHDWNPDLSQLDAMVESLTFPAPAEDAVALPVPGEGETAGIVLAPAGVNVRVGPSAGYPSLGVAPFGTSGILIGKSEDEQWWVVEVPVSELAPEGHGWVAAEFVQATDAEDLPVIAGPTKLETLQLVTWDWFALADPAGMTAVEDSGRYTISFEDEGTAAIKADCNNVTAEYTAGEDSISIELGISTMAACPPDSLDQLFLESLGQAAIYRYEDGNLFLDLDEGAGIMQFKVLDE